MTYTEEKKNEIRLPAKVTGTTEAVSGRQPVAAAKRIMTSGRKGAVFGMLYGHVYIIIML